MTIWIIVVWAISLVVAYMLGAYLQYLACERRHTISKDGGYE
jgi:hypothetical protein